MVGSDFCVLLRMVGLLRQGQHGEPREFVRHSPSMVVMLVTFLVIVMLHVLAIVIVDLAQFTGPHFSVF